MVAPLRSDFQTPEPAPEIRVAATVARRSRGKGDQDVFPAEHRQRLAQAWRKGVQAKYRTQVAIWHRMLGRTYCLI
jgi:hypothetical protein